MYRKREVDVQKPRNGICPRVEKMLHRGGEKVVGLHSTGQAFLIRSKAGFVREYCEGLQIKGFEVINHQI